MLAATATEFAAISTQSMKRLPFLRELGTGDRAFDVESEWFADACKNPNARSPLQRFPDSVLEFDLASKDHAKCDVPHCLPFPKLPM